MNRNNFQNQNRGQRQNYGPPRWGGPPIELMEAGNLHQALLTQTAEKAAEKIFSDHESARKDQKLTTHQLRRFYNDVKGLQRRVEADPGNFPRYWPLFGMLKAKVAYAANPKKPKIPGQFQAFINTCVEAVEKAPAENRKDHFLAFCVFFEAVVGYLYGLGIADN